MDDSFSVVTSIENITPLELTPDGALQLAAPEQVIAYSSISGVEAVAAEGVKWTFDLAGKQPERGEAEHRFFGAHIHEAVEIIKDWKRNP